MHSQNTRFSAAPIVVRSGPPGVLTPMVGDRAGQGLIGGPSRPATSTVGGGESRTATSRLGTVFAMSCGGWRGAVCASRQ